MTGNDQALSPKQEMLIAELIGGNNITIAAKVAGIGDKTARRWLKLPHFQQAYKAAQKQVFETALAALLLKVEKAVDTLDRNMDSVEAPAAAQIRAAQIVLEQANNVHKMREMEERLGALENLVTQPRGRDWRVVS